METKKWRWILLEKRLVCGRRWCSTQTLGQRALFHCAPPWGRRRGNEDAGIFLDRGQWRVGNGVYFAKTEAQLVTWWDMALIGREKTLSSHPLGSCSDMFFFFFWWLKCQCILNLWSYFKNTCTLVLFRTVATRHIHGVIKSHDGVKAKYVVICNLCLLNILYRYCCLLWSNAVVGLLNLCCRCMWLFNISIVTILFSQ